MQLESSSEKTIWTGFTDKTGSFEIRDLAPGLFHLEIDGWGNRNVRLLAQRYFGSGQTVFWQLTLYGKACVYLSGSMN